MHCEQNKSFTKFHVTVTEGRNREIRKMFLTAGKEVKFLKRIKIGDLGMGGLDRGHSFEDVTASKVLKTKSDVKQLIPVKLYEDDKKQWVVNYFFYHTNPDFSLDIIIISSNIYRINLF